MRAGKPVIPPPVGSSCASPLQYGYPPTHRSKRLASGPANMFGNLSVRRKDHF